MARAPEGLLGRDEQLAALAPDGPGGVLVAVGGAPGSGRSALLAAAGAAGRAAGRTVLHVELARGRAEWDEYGVAPLVDAVLACFEDLPVSSDLVRATAALRRRCTVDAYGSTPGRTALLAEAGRLLARIGPEAALVLLDDVEVLPHPGHLAGSARRAGHRVVAAGRPAGSRTRADRVVELEPLTDDAVELLLRRRLRRPPDQGLVATLREALGPWFGNPHTLVATVERLQHDGRLLAVERRICLRDPHRLPELPAGTPPAAALGEVGGPAESLVLLADGVGTAPRGDDVPVVAAATRWPAERVGEAYDRLVAGGILGDDGDPGLRCPALGATARRRRGPGGVAALHAALVRAAVDGAAVPARDADVLADHVAAAGDALAPDPAWATVLGERASRVERADPRHAAALLRAAVRHAERPERHRLWAWALRLLLRSGDHAALGELTTEVVGDPDAVDRIGRGLLAAAASVAALSRWRPVPGAVREALCAPGDPDCPAVLVDRWLRGDTLDVRALVRGFGVLAPLDHVTRLRHTGTRPVEAALVTRDLLAALGHLLGPSYGAPLGGPLLLMHRVSAGYRAGRWDDALAAARSLVADQRGEDEAGDLREMVALLAADIAIWRGDARALAFWEGCLPASVEHSTYPLFHADVRAARLLGEGRGEEAVAQGWRVWSGIDPGADAFGRRALLTRLAGLAALSGSDAWNARLIEAADGWCARAAGAEAHSASDTRDVVRGLLGRGPAARHSIMAAIGRSRARDDRAEVMWFLLVSGAAGVEPAAHWVEAHRLARELGATVLRARVRALLDDHGLRLPVTRTVEEGLSATQRRIVELVEKGLTNRRIAREIRISEKTVENHLTRLFLRFGCRTRHGLATVRLAERHGEVGA